jgi:hypothetical protein
MDNRIYQLGEFSTATTLDRKKINTSYIIGKLLKLIKENPIRY